MFNDLVRKSGDEDRWEVDSAAIKPWHVGDEPNTLALAIMAKYNLFYENKARQIQNDDFRKYDYIFGMDLHNVYDLSNLAPHNSKAKIFLFGDFNPDGPLEIQDPYGVCQ